MNALSWIDRIPMSVLFVLTILLAIGCIFAGMGLNSAVKPAGGAQSIGSVVGATLGLVAFMLAFTFNLAANRFDVRKQLLLEEVNAIGTAYLRAELLPKPFGADVRRLLREYVDLRVRGVQDPRTLEEVIVKSEAIQEKLWLNVVNMSTAQPVTPVQNLFIRSLNEVIDLQTKRVTVGLRYRIPGTIWTGLYLISALAMVAVGYQSGPVKRRQYPVNIVLALAFASVILLIADLDRESEGTILVSQQPILSLQQRLHASPDN